MSGTPYFSILVPMYNRQVEIGRAIDSCLAQTDADFEIVIVDDHSTDTSVDKVSAYADERIRLLTHDANRGACAARNTGARSARGEWLVFLDSDDELLPNALETIRRRIADAGPRVDKLLLMCRYTNGETSPDPAFPDQEWDYADYVAWVGRMIGRRTEALPVTRRTAFLQSPYLDGHAPEALHELNFVRHFRVFACPDVVRVYHQDAAVRVVRPTTEWLRQNGPRFASGLDMIIEDHGDALARYAVSLLVEHQRASAYYHFFGGERRAGLRRIAQALRAQPLAPRSWLLGVLGLLGPWALSLGKGLRR
jgi:glycosyltransferase involved in cell wall biosynthesis